MYSRAYFYPHEDNAIRFDSDKAVHLNYVFKNLLINDPK